MNVARVSAVEREEGHLVLSGQLPQQVVTPDLPPRIEGNQAAGFDPEDFHAAGSYQQMPS
jgi:hypothetical protein